MRITNFVMLEPALADVHVLSTDPKAVHYQITSQVTGVEHSVATFAYSFNKLVDRRLL